MHESFSWEQQAHDLEKEVMRLRRILEEAGISYTLPPSKENITPRHALDFYSMFKGRKDVFSKRTPRKDGSVAYYPVCENFWKEGICPRLNAAKTRCMECKSRKWKPLNQRVLMNHLIGIREDGGDVIGIYPLLENDTCNFLVFDFDSHDAPLTPEWKEEVNALRDICRHLSIPILVERSRSGRGAHVWIFFSEPIPAKTARQFGSALLTKGAESVNQKNFRTYDRMIPAQDYLPEGGLGNLIALPLQGLALRQGNSAFVDENWNAYPNQWEALKNTHRISQAWIEKQIQAWGINEILGPLTTLALPDDNQTRPWERKRPTFGKKILKESLQLTYANMIYIDKQHLPPHTQNALRRMAAFSNPQFYRAQAMGFSTARIPRIICCSRDEESHIALPRGLKDELLNFLNASQVSYSVDDSRQTGKRLKVSFSGQLYPEQQIAANEMLRHENGILHAATAFGKTAVGAYMVAARQVNTLVLVHNREIMKNWIDDFQKFLVIDEEMPEYVTKTGRKRKRKSLIGSLHTSHDSITGLIDVVMFSSLGSGDDIADIVRNYGMVIMDECHHAAAQTAENVLRNIPAKFVYGLTATPKRDDGMETKMLMQLGPIRHRFTALQKAEAQNVQRFVRPRFTLLNNPGPEWKINEVYQALINDTPRNQLIIDDTLEAIAEHRTPLILTKFRSHAAELRSKLTPHIQHVLLLQGGENNRAREELRRQLQSIPPDESLAVVAIGKYIGEGFNLPRLDTLMLASPIAWEGNVEQYAGRLHRDYTGKKEVIIYDYVDSNIRVLNSMYHKRLRAYRKIGYALYPRLNPQVSVTNAIFDTDTYAPVLEQDIARAEKEIIISNPDLTSSKVNWITAIIPAVQKHGIRITIITQPAEKYPAHRQTAILHLHARLTATGIHLNLQTPLHHHFAIIDRQLVWHGNLNILGKERAANYLIRMQANDIASALLSLYSSQSETESQLPLFEKIQNK